MIIIFNPVAGRRRAQALWKVLDILSANGVRLDVQETRCPGHATALARDAAKHGAQLVVAAGGDGTIAEVAAGLEGKAVKLGVIPTGTANVLAHELKLPFTPRTIAAALAFGRTQPLWPGVFTSDSAQRLFVQMVGVGFDGHVVHGLPVALKKYLGRTAYVIQTLRALRSYQFPPVTLRIDGTETQTASAIISKGRYYGGPYVLADEAIPGQPGFAVSLFDNSGLASTLLMGAALPLGLLPLISGVRQLRAREIVVTGNTSIPVQTDGDVAGVTPFRITDASAPISIITS